MDKLYLNNKGVKIPIGEIEVISTKEQVVLGNLDRDLILRTSGNIKIQVGNKFFDLPIVSQDNTSGSILIPNDDSLIVVNTLSDLAILRYPKEGTLVYVRGEKSLHIAVSGDYQLLNSPNQNKIYLSFDESQYLTGSQKYTLAINTGNTVNSMQDIVNLHPEYVYQDMIILSLYEGKHYQLKDVSNPTIIESWKEMYLSTNGGTITGPVTINNSRLLLDSKYKEQWLPRESQTFDGLFLGDPNYSNGLGIWKTDDNIIFSSQADSTFGYKFITKGSTEQFYNPLSISNNSVGIGAPVNYAYSLNVGGLSKFINKATLDSGINSGDFSSGIFGTGYDLSKDSQGKWTFEVDKLIVRGEGDNATARYKTTAVDGSLILNFSVIVNTADLLESIPIVIQGSKAGRYSNTSGAVMPMSAKARYVTVNRIPLDQMDFEDSVTKVTQLIKLSYGIGDKLEDGSIAPYTTYAKLENGSYGVIPDTVKVDTINVWEVNVNTNKSSFSVGDLLYYKEWNANKEQETVIYAEVVAITEYGIILYVYNNGTVSEGTTLIKIGNKIAEETLIQLNSSDKNSPYIEVANHITDFNDFGQNVYYTPFENETSDDTSTSALTDLQVRVKMGQLRDLVNVPLGLTGAEQSGLYSDNAYIKGNLVGNKVIFGTHLDFRNDVLWIKDLETVKARTITGTGALEGGGVLFDADIQIKHKGKAWVNKPNLTEGKVISNLIFDDWGHVIDWTVRDISPAGSGDGHTHTNKNLLDVIDQNLSLNSLVKFNGLTLGNLSGPDTRMVVVDGVGALSSQPIPSGGGGGIASVGITSANGFSGTSSGGSNPSLTIRTTVNGLLKGNGTSISAATAADIPALNYLPLTGGVLTGNLGVQLSNGNAATIHLAIGDSDTGFDSVGDGNLNFVANGVVNYRMQDVWRTNNFNPNSKFNIIINEPLNVNSNNINGGGKLFNATNTPHNYGTFLSYGEGVYTTQFSASNIKNGELLMRVNGDGGVGDWRVLYHTGNINIGTTAVPWSVVQRDVNGNIYGNDITSYGWLYVGNSVISPDSVTSPVFNGSLNGNASSVTNGVYTNTFNGLGDARYLRLTGGTLTGNVTGPGFFNSSDMTLKDLIPKEELNIDKLEMIAYTWKSDELKQKHYGYSAQAVQILMPDAIQYNSDGKLTVNYTEVLVAKVDKLEREVKQLKSLLQI